MGFSPGRNAGRVSIRVVPDTTKFRQELRRSLGLIEKSTKFTVNVDRANLNRTKIREDIRRQMESMRDFAVDVDVTTNVRDVLARDIKRASTTAKVTPTMDTLTINRLRREMHKSLGTIEADLKANIDDRRLRQQLDHMAAAFEKVSGRLAHDIMSPADAEALRHRLNDIKDHIDKVAANREARLEVNPFTAWATARLAWLTRPRTVEIFVKLNKKSLVAFTSTLAALSGARLTWKWVDDLLEQMKELDRNLPKFLGWTTGITSLVASIFAATSGLVGIGQGLFSILPAFLVLPGLILNAGGSITALIVALRNAGDELSVLKDDMHELGDIINETFWGRARQPITDLVQNLMPQLRTSFRDLSAGIGDFTAAMADSFGRELANGRLASIFNGIAEGWRVLATGADGFAGALVSLSNIAAQYTPRLAAWFVRQANTFDTWLKSISEDGRLGAWMETAIDSMYDLWDATTGVAGIFEGLWKAAESAGSEGLDGFAKLMQTWKRVVNSADFQRGLTAVFRGSHAAMDAFGGAVRALGRLFSDNAVPWERFIGSAGRFFGGILEAALDALNSPQFANGLRQLSVGLDLGLEKIIPALQPIADTFGDFIGLLGDMASTVLPTAAGVLAELMPSISSLIGSIEDVLPDLTTAVSDIARELGPAIADFVETAGPVLAQALSDVASILVEVAPLLSDLVGIVGDMLGSLGITKSVRENQRAFEQSGMAPNPADYDNAFAYFQDYVKEAQEFMDSKPFKPSIKDFDVNKTKQMIQTWYEGTVDAYETGGYDAAAAYWNEYQLNSLTPAVKNGIVAKLKELGYDLKAIGVEDGSKAGLGAGAGMSKGIADGIAGGKPALNGAARGAVSGAVAAAREVGGMFGIGQALATGIAAGIRDKIGSIASAAAGAVGAAVSAAKRAGDIHSPSRKARREIGWNWGDGVALGIDDRRARVEASSRRMMDAASIKIPSSSGSGSTPAYTSRGGVNIHLHNPALRDWQRDMAEAADMAGVLL